MNEPADPSPLPPPTEPALPLRRRSRLPLVILVLVALAGAAVWRLGGGRLQPWQVTLERDFAQLAAPTDDITQGFWGTPRAAAASRDPSGFILLRNQEVLQLPPQDAQRVRLTAVIEWPERVDGFEIGLRASPYPPDSSWEAPASYMCQFGGYGGRRTFAVAHRRQGTPEPPTEVTVPWRTGQRYTVSFEVDGDRLVQRVDGREVLSLYEPLAVGDDTFRNVFLRSWAPSLRLHSLRIERVNEAVLPNPLAAGDALAGAGLHRRAVDAYLRVAEGTSDGAVAERAYAKAAIAAIADGQSVDLARDLIARLEAKHPRSPLLQTCDEVLASARYAAGDEQALALAERTRQRHPASRIGEILTRNRPTEPRAEDAPRLLALLAGAGQAQVLQLNRFAIADLAPLAPLRLQTLYAARNAIADLAPLAGMPLQTLDISWNRVSSLAPLAKLPLTRLSAAGNPLRDLAPLAGLQLQQLDLSRTAVADLAPLAGMPLGSFTASGSAVVDLTPLRGLALGYAAFANTRVADLAPLAGNPALGRLDLPGSEVADLTPLRGSRLGQLDLAWTPVGDLAPLAGMPLTVLGLRGTRVADLAPLSGVALVQLDLRGTAVRDLAPLAGAKLGRLWLPTGCRDLAPLAGQPLALLQLDAPQGVDLAPVAQDRLADLRLRDGSGIDLSPLAGRPLASLDLCGTRVRSFEPILRLPALTTLRLVGASADEGGLEALAEGLRRQGRRPLARCADIGQLVAQHDAARLRELASELPDRRLRLELGLRCGAAQARRTVAALGGRLPQVTSPADHEQLLGMLVAADSTWLDLEASADGRSDLRSSAGRPFPWSRMVAAGDLLSAHERRAWHLLRARTEVSIFGSDERDAESIDQGVVVEWDPQ